jgi:hypothetical protein
MAKAMGLTEGLLQRLDKDTERQITQDRDFLEYRLFKQFYDKQREILYDRNIQRKIICTSRRWGKTETAAGKFVLTAVEGDVPMYYIHLNVTNAVNQMWRKVVKYSESIDLPIEKEDHTTHEIRWTNGSVLRFRGNNTSAEADKLRGDPARLVIIDEAGAQRWMRYLADEVLSPMFADFGTRGELIIQGTPPKIPKTFFEMLWDKSGYKKYAGNIFDNPFIPEGYLEGYLKERKLSMEDPFIQREYLGVVGAYDTEAMIYRFRSYHKETPAYRITDIAIGIDYGHQDCNAIIGLAFNRESGAGYIFFEEKFNKEGASFICEKALEAHKEALKIASANNMDRGRIVLVADTNEESITFDMVTKYNLPARNAYKYNKEYAMELLARTLKEGQITMVKDGPLDQELGGLIWFRDEEGHVIHEIDDVYGEHPDAGDALLYAFREYRHICKDTSLEIPEEDDPFKYLPRRRSGLYG